MKGLGQEFPGGPAVRTPSFHCRGTGSIPGWENKIPHAVQPSPAPHPPKKKGLGHSILQEENLFQVRYIWVAI